MAKVSTRAVSIRAITVPRNMVARGARMSIRKAALTAVETSRIRTPTVVPASTARILKSTVVGGYKHQSASTRMNSALAEFVCAECDRHGKAMTAARPMTFFCQLELHKPVMVPSPLLMMLVLLLKGLILREPKFGGLPLVRQAGRATGNVDGSMQPSSSLVAAAPFGLRLT